MVRRERRRRGGLLAARPRLPDRRVGPPTRSTRATSDAPLPRFEADAIAANQALADRVEPSPDASAPSPPRSPWPGCWRRASTSSPSRGRSACAGSSRISALPTSCCPRTIWRNSTRCRRPRARATGRARAPHRRASRAGGARASPGRGDHRRVDHPAVVGHRTATVADPGLERVDDRLRLCQLLGARGEHPVHDLELARVDARLASEAEAPSRARTRARARRRRGCRDGRCRTVAGCPRRPSRAPAVSGRAAARARRGAAAAAARRKGRRRPGSGAATAGWEAIS